MDNSSSFHLTEILSALNPRTFVWMFKETNIPLSTATIAQNYKGKIIYSLSITLDPHQLHVHLSAMIRGSPPRSIILINLFRCIIYSPAKNFYLNFASNSCFFFCGLSLNRQKQRSRLQRRLEDWRSQWGQEMYIYCF